MLLASLLIATLRPPLQMELRATRLTEIVKDLATKLDRRLYVSPELSNRVLIVRFDGVDPDLALQRIALATDAEWIERGQNTVLVISPGRQAALTAKWYEARTKGIQNAIEEIAKPLVDHPRFDMKEAKKLEEDLHNFDTANEGREEEGMSFFKNMQTLFARGPGGRAIAQILRECDPGEIARLPLSSHSVFATNPNRLQRAMPQGTGAVLTNLRADMTTWKQAMESAPGRPQKDGWYGGDPRHTEISDAKAAKVLLRFDVFGPISTINVRLCGYDADGKCLFSNDGQIDPGFFKVGEDNANMQVAVGKDPNYDLSEESRHWLAFQDLTYSTGERPDAEWTKVLADPLTRDPLSFMPSECILAYAKLSKKNLVANVTDDLLSIPDGLVAKPKVNLVGYLNFLKGFAHYAIDQDDQWIQIKPDGQMGPPQYPEDRGALKRLLDTTLANGYLTIDALAEYARTMDRSWNTAGFYSLRVLLPRSERLLQSANMPALRFFGDLSPSQRKALIDGGEVSLATTAPAAKDALYKFASSVDSPEFGDGLYLDGENLAGSPNHPLGAEPSEIFANGVPAGAIQAKTFNDSFLLVGTQNTKYAAWTNLVTPEGYANGRKKPDSVYTDNDDFWLGSLFSLKLNVGLGGRMSMQMNFKEHRYDLRKQPLKRDGLPAEVRRKIGD